MQTIRKKLQETFAHAEGRLTLTEQPTNACFLNETLAIFDYNNSSLLEAERRTLSGEVSTHNTHIPASFAREVIRESLADLPILELIQPRTDPQATVNTQIPYELRTVAAGDLPNDGVVFEGQSIPYAGVSLSNETAYMLPMKLALKLSNEIMHFSSASQINWNAWADNIASNSRVIRELLHYRLAKEIQRASDSYQAKSVTDESVTVGENSIIKTAKFPVVCPFQQKDLRGLAVGAPENPLTLTIDDANIPFFIGGDLEPGLYWRFENINLGYIQLVNESGEPAGEGKTGTISYDYPTNLFIFDLNHDSSVTYPEHLNGLLNTVADAKALLTGKRICRPEFGLMSATLNAEAAKASQFAVSLARPGTTTTGTGDLEAIKALPIWEAQGGHIADERILLGQRGTTTYTIAKPWTMGQPFDAIGDRGRPTGEKVCYGEEFSAIHTPKAIRNRYTSVLVFDSTTR